MRSGGGSGASAGAGTLRRGMPRGAFMGMRGLAGHRAGTPRGLSRVWGRHVPRRIRRDAHSAGGACRVNTGGRGMPRGAMSAGAFRVWAGRQSLCVDVQGLGGTAISAQERFVPGRNSGLRAWTFRVWARRRSLCRRRFVSGRDSNHRTGGVLRLGGTAILARETAGRSGATGRARECPHALYGSGGATISSFSAAGASVAAQSRQSPTSARHRQAIRCPRRNTSVSPAQRVRKPPARPSPVSFR